MRVLFVAESVTLAHVARPIALATALQARGHVCALACSDDVAHFAAGQGLTHLPIDSLPSAHFVEALARGRPVFDATTLERQVHDDLRLLRGWQPDLVIGDFRLSLSVSARLHRVPYAAISNVYWSPDCTLAPPLPVLPLTRHLPLPLAGVLFRLGAPVVMARHAGPLNQVRQQYGLASVPGGLRGVYSEADHLLLADAPGIFPVQAMPPTHHFLGPVLWSPAVQLPPWWTSLPEDRPLVYASIGSSGAPETLQQVFDALSDMPCGVIAATAGGVLPADFSGADGPWLARYLPGDQATQRAAMVVCNGGSMTSQQALLLGRPILGIASNMDQFMNMSAVVRAGAGICLRADRLTPRAVREACSELLGNPARQRAAQALGDRLRGWDAGERLSALLPAMVRRP